MTDHELAKQLRSVRFLQGLPLSYVQALAEIGQLREFPAEKVIFREGEEARSTYLVLEGQVGLDICAPSTGCRRICTLTAGDLLGWSPLLELSLLTATARALVPTRVVEIAAEPLLELCERDLQFGFEFMRRTALALSKRLSATRLQLLDIYGHHMPTAPAVSVAPGTDA